MKSIFVTILIILFSLVLIKNNTNNLQFMTGNADVEIYETFINPETNFICEKDDIACILSYQKYNPECQNSFGVWKQFQDLNHGKNLKGKKIKILAVDSSLHPNLRIGGNVDGPKVTLVTRYNMRDYNGILNLENLQAFLNDSI